MERKRFICALVIFLSLFRPVPSFAADPITPPNDPSIIPDMMTLEEAQSGSMNQIPPEMQAMAAAMNQQNSMPEATARMDWTLSPYNLAAVEAASKRTEKDEDIAFYPIQVAIIDTLERREEAIEQFRKVSGDTPLNIQFYNAGDSSGRVTEAGIHKALNQALNRQGAYAGDLDIVNLPAGLAPGLQKSVTSFIMRSIEYSEWGLFNDLFGMGGPLVVAGMGDPDAPVLSDKRKNELFKSGFFHEETSNVDWLAHQANSLFSYIQYDWNGMPVHNTRDAYDLITLSTEMMQDRFAQMVGWQQKFVVGFIDTPEHFEQVKKQFLLATGNDPRLEIRFYNAADASGNLTAEGIIRAFKEETPYRDLLVLSFDTVSPAIAKKVNSALWRFTEDFRNVVVGADNPFAHLLTGSLSVGMAADGDKVAKGAGDMAVRPEDLLKQETSFAAAVVSGLLAQIRMPFMNRHYPAGTDNLLKKEEFLLSPSKGKWVKGVPPSAKAYAAILLKEAGRQAGQEAKDEAARQVQAAAEKKYLSQQIPLAEKDLKEKARIVSQAEARTAKAERDLANAHAGMSSSAAGKPQAIRKARGLLDAAQREAEEARAALEAARESESHARQAVETAREMLKEAIEEDNRAKEEAKIRQEEIKVLRKEARNIIGKGKHQEAIRLLLEGLNR